MAILAVGKGLRPLQVALVILFVRLLSVFLVQTWYVPDEYWQSLEVAHKHVFDYGALTWEWEKGIRSYLYPGVFAVFYSILKYTGLDYAEVVVLLPRILQALLSTAADYSFYKWAGGRKWALFLVLTSWFWFYTSGRTLLQSTETSLVTIALSLFPFKHGRQSYYDTENLSWFWIACVCVFLRPTSAPLWVVLGVYSLFTTNQNRLRLIFRSYLPIALASVSALVGLDSLFYGRPVVTIWEFFRFNVLNDVASFYGTHPWHWYLSQGLPAVLGVNIVPVLWALYTILRHPRENTVSLLLVVAATVHVAIHSVIPHKEFRFVLPLLPIFLYLAQDVLVRWSRKAKSWQLYTTAGTILIGNLVPALYFGLIHQSGTVKVMPLLRDAMPTNQSTVLFLMPCHSTPLYSHLHLNVTARYLNCDPPLDKIGEGTEAERCFNNPTRWWRAEYAHRPNPDLVVMFDKMRARADPVLQSYRLLHELPHTQFPEGEVSEKVLVLQRVDTKAKVSGTTDDAV